MDQGTLPGGATRNFRSYGRKVGALADEQRAVLCDPQTSGGLLVVVEPAGREEFQRVVRMRGGDLEPIGALSPGGQQEHLVRVV